MKSLLSSRTRSLVVATMGTTLRKFGPSSKSPKRTSFLSLRRICVRSSPSSSSASNAATLSGRPFG